MLTSWGDAFDLGEQPNDLARPDWFDLPSIGSIWLLRTRFVARLGRFAARFAARTCLSGPLRDAPGLDFRARNACFFRSFCVLRTFDAQNVQHRKEIVKTSSTVRNALRSCCASNPNRLKIVLHGSRKAFSNANALNERLGSLQTHLGSVPRALLECSWAVLGYPGSSRERSRGTPNASLAVPGASRPLFEVLPNRSGDVTMP